MSDLRASVSRQLSLSARRRWVWAIAAGLVLVVLGIAAIDGGERALRPISQQIALPASTGSTEQ